MDLDQNIQADVFGGAIQRLEFRRCKRADDEEHAVSTHQPRLKNLVRINGEVFANDGQIYRLAHGSKVGVTSLKILLIG